MQQVHGGRDPAQRVVVARGQNMEEDEGEIVTEDMEVVQPNVITEENNIGEASVDEEHNITENDDDVASLPLEDKTLLPQYDPSDPNLFFARLTRKYCLPREATTELLKWLKSPAIAVNLPHLKNNAKALYKYEKDYYGEGLLVSSSFFYIIIILLQNTCE